MYVFQDLVGYFELTYYVPFVASVLLVALGSDYNVFLAGRIWQAARTRPVAAPPLAPAAPTPASAAPASGAARIALRLIALAIAPSVLRRRRP